MIDACSLKEYNLLGLYFVVIGRERVYFTVGKEGVAALDVLMCEDDGSCFCRVTWEKPDSTCPHTHSLFSIHEILRADVSIDSPE